MFDLRVAFKKKCGLRSRKPSLKKNKENKKYIWLAKQNEFCQKTKKIRNCGEICCKNKIKLEEGNEGSRSHKRDRVGPFV